MDVRIPPPKGSGSRRPAWPHRTGYSHASPTAGPSRCRGGPAVPDAAVGGYRCRVGQSRCRRSGVLAACASGSRRARAGRRRRAPASRRPVQGPVRGRPLPAPVDLPCLDLPRAYRPVTRIDPPPAAAYRRRREAVGGLRAARAPGGEPAALAGPGRVSRVTAEISGDLAPFFLIEDDVDAPPGGAYLIRRTP